MQQHPPHWSAGLSRTSEAYYAPICVPDTSEPDEGTAKGPALTSCCVQVNNLKRDQERLEEVVEQTRQAAQRSEELRMQATSELKASARSMSSICGADPCMSDACCSWCLSACDPRTAAPILTTCSQQGSMQRHRFFTPCWVALQELKKQMEQQLRDVNMHRNVEVHGLAVGKRDLEKANLALQVSQYTAACLGLQCQWCCYWCRLALLWVLVLQ